MLNSVLEHLGRAVGTGLGGIAGKGLGAFAGPLAPLATWAGGLGGTYLGNQAGGYLGNKLAGWLNPQPQNSYNNSPISPNSINSPFLNKIQDAQQNLMGQLQQRPQFQPVDINSILQQTQQQHQNEILPSIANRFSSGGLQHSSAFRNALSSSSADLAQRFSAMRTQNEQNNNDKRLQYEGLVNNRLGMLGNLLGEQSKLGQQGSQFDSDFNRNSWDPYIKAASVGIPLVAAGLNAWSGTQQGQNNLQNQKTNAEAQLGSGQLGQQWSPVQNQASQGLLGMTPQIIQLAVESALKGYGLYKG